LANDSGFRGSVELYLPELLGRSELKLRALAFYDVGGLWRNKPQPGETERITVASTGIGLRGGYGKRLSYRVDWAMVTDGGATRVPGDKRVHASLILSF
jgi:hemolysin activation/secretion protein